MTTQEQLEEFRNDLLEQSLDNRTPLYVAMSLNDTVIGVFDSLQEAQKHSQKAVEVYLNEPSI